MSDEEKTLLDVDLCTEGHRSVLDRSTREGGHASYLGGSKCEHLPSHHLLSLLVVLMIHFLWFIPLLIFLKMDVFICD